MKITEFKKTLPFLLKNRIVPFVWGLQGVGKTQTIKQYCKENDLGLVVLNTATQEVGDLVGLLMKSEDGQTVTHARPTWFPTTGKGIVFLDELNRAPAEVIQALFPFVIDGTLHTHRLPEGWRVVAAGNYQSDKFTVTDTSDAAWLSRFCHLDLVPSVEEWIVHAETLGGFQVADYIRQYNSMLEVSSKDGGRLDLSMVTPDRRSWTEAILKLDMDTEFPEAMRYETYAGIVGTAAASSYLTWKTTAQEGISLNQILGNYAAIRSKITQHSANAKDKRFDLYNQPVEELLLKLEQNPKLLASEAALNNLKAFLLDIPRELAMKSFVSLGELLDADKDIAGLYSLLNDPEYVTKFMRHAA